MKLNNVVPFGRPQSGTVIIYRTKVKKATLQ